MRRLCTLLVVSALVLVPSSLAAQNLKLPQLAGKAAHVQASIHLKEASVQPGTAIHVVIELEHEKGWHTYWKVPGAAGLPTSVTWTLPAGWKADELEFPAPKRIVLGDLVSYGYEGTSYFRQTLEVPASASGDYTLQARVSWLACEVECVPESARFTLNVKTGPAADDPAKQARFDAANTSFWRDVKANAEAGRSGDQILLRTSGLPASLEGTEFELFPISEGLAPAKSLAARVTQGALEFRLSAATQNPLSSVSAELYSKDGTSRIAVEAPIAVADSTQAPSSPASTSFVAAFLLALLGGLVLNLMPCVLPVLALKLYALIEARDETRRRNLRQGLAYASGIVTVFVALAVLILVLKNLGLAVGWGFQFQEPLVVAALAFVFFLMALNFLGVFEFNIRVRRKSTGVIVGGARKHGAGKSFAQGALMVVAASPCTAPFMGSALGYAFAATPLETLGIFLGLGLGLALPMVVLSLFPALIKRFPKPGAWMVKLRQVLAFPLFGTVLWLASVLARGGSASVFALFWGLLALALGAWIWGSLRPGAKTRRGKILAIGLALATAGGGIAWTSASLSAPGANVDTVTAGWRVFHSKDVEAARAESKPVFIDFTADWCLTCKWNEATTLDRADIVDLFNQRGIERFKADWTLRNDEIANAVRAYGRSGIPLYVWYPAGSKDPQILSELLTPAYLEGVLAKK